MSALIEQARRRAAILHASAAWGTDGDAHYMGALADEVERLTAALEFLADAARTTTGFASPMALAEADKVLARHKGGEA
jgi:hypothetical protein